MEKKLWQYYDEIKNNTSVNESMFYFESHNGNDLGGNLYYLAKEIIKNRYESIIYVLIKNPELIPINVRKLMEYDKNDCIRLISKNTYAHIYAMAVSKYLVTDVQFSYNFEKRTDQVCIQTWHGTPLKKLGYDYINDVTFSGGQKKSFIDADIIIYPNDFTERVMTESYRLNKLCSNSSVYKGYPRNSIFFDFENMITTRKKERLENKKVYVYMPTWRGGILSTEGIEKEQLNLLSKIDSLLNDNEVLYVKMHRLVSDRINFDNYLRIKPFPEKYETYQFLAIADCLITDYSSVMFDFLCTKKKIVLYTYDKKKYFKQQGTYFDMEHLPFPQVETVNKLVEEIRKIKEYNDDEVYNEFCCYDGKHVAEKALQFILNYRKETSLNTDKNILLYGGDLEPGWHTVDFVNFVDSIDSYKYNKIVTYKNIDFIKRPIKLQVFNKNTDLLSIDYCNGDLYYDTDNFKNVSLYDSENILKKAFDMQFHNIIFDKVICYVDRYDLVLEMLSMANCDVTIVIDDRYITNEDYEKIRQMAEENKIMITKNLNLVQI